MVKAQNNTNFATLFKKYRLRSEIETLSQFGDLLAEQGLVYENSLFTHWQKGDRVPRDRQTILAVIKLFVEREGIRSIEDANSLLSSLEMKDLTKEETEICALAHTGTNEKYSSEWTVKLSFRDHMRLITSSLFRVNASKLLIAVFALHTMWFLRLSFYHLENKPESYIWGASYGFLALIGGMYGIAITKKSTSNSTSFIRAVRWLSAGLFFQLGGLYGWTIYNLLGIAVPYPSFADLGYLACVPCYILAALQFTHLRFFYEVRKKIIYLSLPIIGLLICYSIFLHATGVLLVRQVTIFLNFSYPSGETIPILVLAYTLTSPALYKNSLYKSKIILLMVAFTMQFLADYMFIYAVQINQYVNGGINDFIYSIAYCIMSFVIISLSDDSVPNFVKQLANQKKIGMKKKITLLSFPVFPKI